jgi:cell division protein FtsQ
MARGTKHNPPRRGCLRKVLTLFQALFFLAVVGGGSYAVYRHLQVSPDYQVRQVLVEGIQLLTAEEIIAASGIAVGDNVVFTKTAAAAERVAALPLVKSATVSRRFPDEVLVQVEERQPVATLLAGNRAFEVDGDSFVIRETSPGEAIRQPLISEVPDLGVVEVGQQLDAPALREALALWRVFEASAVGGRLTLSEIAAYDPKNLRMYFEELGYEVRWGRGNYAEQVARLDVLWQELGEAPPCTEYLDLRFEPDIICK